MDSGNQSQLLKTVFVLLATDINILTIFSLIISSELLHAHSEEAFRLQRPIYVDRLLIVAIVNIVY